MFYRKTQESSRLDEAIEDALTRMLSATDMKEYATYANQLNQLYKLQEQETPKRISPDTLLLVGGNLLGIVMILSYEKANVLTSRAIAFVMKLR